MKEYKIIIKKGNGYFDPKLNLNINSPTGSKIITEEDILSKEVDNIDFAVKTGVIVMKDLDTGEKVLPSEVKEELKEENDIDEDITIEENEEDEEQDNDDNEDEVEEFTTEEEIETEYEVCQATTQTGEQCSNQAVYPEDDPQYCHISSHKKEYNENEE